MPQPPTPADVLLQRLTREIAEHAMTTIGRLTAEQERDAARAELETLRARLADIPSHVDTQPLPAGMEVR